MDSSTDDTSPSRLDASTGDRSTSATPDATADSAACIPGAPSCDVIAELDDCDVQTVMQFVVGDESVIDCGSIELTTADVDVAAAHDCMATAIASELPFRADWDLEGIDSDLRRGAIGLATRAGFEIYSFGYDSITVYRGGPNRPTSWFLCSEPMVPTTCPEHTTLCLDCAVGGDEMCHCALGDDGGGRVLCQPLER